VRHQSLLRILQLRIEDARRSLDGSLAVILLPRHVQRAKAIRDALRDNRVGVNEAQAEERIVPLQFHVDTCPRSIDALVVDLSGPLSGIQIELADDRLYRGPDLDLLGHGTEPVIRRSTYERLDLGLRDVLLDEHDHGLSLVTARHRSICDHADERSRRQGYGQLPPSAPQNPGDVMPRVGLYLHGYLAPSLRCATLGCAAPRVAGTVVCVAAGT